VVSAAGVVVHIPQHWEIRILQYCNILTLITPSFLWIKPRLLALGIDGLCLPQGGDGLLTHPRSRCHWYT
jgi:hypothetical protein